MCKTLRNVEILNEDETTQTALQKLFGEIVNVTQNVKVVTLVFLK